MKVPRNDHVIEYVDAFLHDALDADDATFVEQHCDDCSICSAALDEARNRLELINTVPHSEASDSLIRSTIDSIDTRVSRRSKRWRIYRNTVLLLVAASVLLVAGMHRYYERLSASPYDLRVMGQKDWLAGSVSTLRLAVFDNRTGKPMSNVPVKLALRNRATSDTVELVSFVTGSVGEETPRFQLPEWAEGQYDLLFTASLDGVEETLPRVVRLKRKWKLMLSTDKPIYQPGQTIHMRSMSLRQPDLKPLADQKSVFEIVDPKGNIIFRKEGTTSKFGISSADCNLAHELNLGTYTVKCRMNDTTSSRTVKVQKYVLPKFRVAVSPDRPYYVPSQTMNLVVQTDYFFGKPVTGAKVALEVYGNAAGLFEITKEEREADENGKATFSIDLPSHFAGRPQNNGDATVEIFAKVTDSTGMQYTKKVKRIVTSNPIHIEVIPENPSLTPGIANRVYLYTSYADGRPAKTKVIVHGINQDIETNELGVATFDITPGNDPLDLTLKASDSEGATGRKHVRLNEGKSGAFVLRTNKAVFNGGDTISIGCLGTGIEPVFVDLVKEDQSLVTLMVEMAHGKGNHEIELPPEVFGPIHVVAHRFDHEGLAIQKSRAIFVRQPNELQIKATLDRDEYRPGELAKVKFTVTDDKGKSVPSALSLSIVDEAVFSVMDQAAGMEKVFFLLENELLQPVFAIYDWTPDWTGEIAVEEREIFEQALFSRTASDHVNNYSLTATSFPAKQAQVTSKRNSGLKLAHRSWLWLGGGWLAVAIGTFAVAQPKWFAIIVGGIFLFVLLAIPVAFFLLVVTVGKDAAFETMENAVMPGEWAPAADGGMDPTAMPMEMAPGDDLGGAPVTLPSIRKQFPETLLWNPELVTDENGVATLEIPLADSITTWRVTSSAISTAGQLGTEQNPIRVFQPFFVDLNTPYALTRLDEAAIPVVVYNYLDKPQTVQIKMDEGDWFEWLDADGSQAEMTVELTPNEVRAVSFPVRILKAGKHQFTVTAIAGENSDAIQRPITILPGGEKVEYLSSGTLLPSVTEQLSVPDDAVENSVTAYVKIYPSTFSELVEGLDNIFRMPNGCFEQTSSTTYPNVLALDYLRRNKKSVPEIEAKARQYIHVGYQRLVSFEVKGGGFDWFGNPPANITLTAYGLMEFEDMAKVHDVDPKLIHRTRLWLLGKRQADGSWKPIERGLNDGLLSSVERGSDTNLALTAYVAWAVFYNGAANEEAAATLDYLLSHPASTIDDPYLLATIANAIAHIDPDHGELSSYLDRLNELKKTSEDGKLVWWEQSQEDQTLFFGNGNSGKIETTALVTQALIRTKQHANLTRAALTWLVQQKDANGTWHSTQATVLALQALIQATNGLSDSEKEREIEIRLDGELVRKLKITADQADVVQLISLTDQMTNGDHAVTISEPSETQSNFQLVFDYHLPSESMPTIDDSKTEPLEVILKYDRTRLQVNDRITATATVINKTDKVAAMVILDLPIPGGFVIERGELDELQGAGLIEKYQITPRKAIVYLRGISPSKPIRLRYRLKATMPVKVQVAPAEAYQYYDPDQRGKSDTAVFQAQAT